MRYQTSASTRRACALPIMMCLFASAGCQRTARDLALDQAVARNSLTAFLDCWQRGEPTTALQSSTPAIIGRDPAWDAGRRLIRYTIGSETDDGTNLHVTTQLVFGSQRGEDPAEPVTYIVGTSPVITIFRNE